MCAAFVVGGGVGGSSRHDGPTTLWLQAWAGLLPGWLAATLAEYQKWYHTRHYVCGGCEDTVRYRQVPRPVLCASVLFYVLLYAYYMCLHIKSDMKTVV